MPVSCKCCVLSGRGLCIGLITSPTVCGVSECDREASVMRWPWPLWAVAPRTVVNVTSNFVKVPRFCMWRVVEKKCLLLWGYSFVLHTQPHY